MRCTRAACARCGWTCFCARSWPTADIIAYIERSVRRTRAIGWHVQFYTPGWVVRDLLPFLAGLDADFVIDHMGYMLESDGLTDADFDRLLGSRSAGAADGSNCRPRTGLPRTAISSA